MFKKKKMWLWLPKIYMGLKTDWTTQWDMTKNKPNSNNKNQRLFSTSLTICSSTIPKLLNWGVQKVYMGEHREITESAFHFFPLHIIREVLLRQISSVVCTKSQGHFLLSHNTFSSSSAMAASSEPWTHVGWWSPITCSLNITSIWLF